ncbi:type II secretion system F family protein [Ramlibacter sp.]|uniref:type II secretion system F family protein n=1 Tax=Ramlibacter sp. TaxID=1917967 RepID=UPI002B609B26|nr:type II secretion system F family protein [Ramlibacter sp.]HWI81804.1 type II secretion system F family protein [Ramlibacter sp.]
MLSILGNNFIVLTVLLFITVLLLLEGLYLLWRANHGPQATRLQRRLQDLATARRATQNAQLLKQGALSDAPAMQRMLQGFSRMRLLERTIMQSGLNWTVSRLLTGCAVLALAGWVAMSSVAHETATMSALAALAAASLPLLYLHRRRKQRLARIEAQLPEALDLMSRGLRAGHAFSSVLKMAGEELAQPVAGEFRGVHEEVNFGISLQQALTNLSERVPITDLRYFVVAVLVQRESGGNLTEILDNLSRLLRERAKLLGRVRVLSAEGRMSAWILVIMPFALAAAMNLVNPKFMSLLWTDPIGISLIKFMLALMVFGVLAMRQIIRIRV